MDYQELSTAIKEYKEEIDQLKWLLEYKVYKSDITSDYFLWKWDGNDLCLGNSYSLVSTISGREYFLRLDYMSYGSFLEFSLEKESDKWGIKIDIYKTRHRDVKFSLDIEDWLIKINRTIEDDIWEEISRLEKRLAELEPN